MAYVVGASTPVAARVSSGTVFTHGDTIASIQLVPGTYDFRVLDKDLNTWSLIGLDDPTDDFLYYSGTAVSSGSFIYIAAQATPNSPIAYALLTYSSSGSLVNNQPLGPTTTSWFFLAPSSVEGEAWGVGTSGSSSDLVYRVYRVQLAGASPAWELEYETSGSGGPNSWTVITREGDVLRYLASSKKIWRLGSSSWTNISGDDMRMADSSTMTPPQIGRSIIGLSAASNDNQLGFFDLDLLTMQTVDTGAPVTYGTSDLALFSGSTLFVLPQSAASPGQKMDIHASIEVESELTGTGFFLEGFQVGTNLWGVGTASMGADVYEAIERPYAGPPPISGEVYLEYMEES